jgi:hypothetical protein
MNTIHHNWLKELPEESGDYLWVLMWTCDCCVNRSGIAWIEEATPEDKPNFYYEKNGKGFGIWWGVDEKQWPTVFDGMPEVDGYLLLDLPESGTMDRAKKRNEIKNI